MFAATGKINMISGMTGEEASRHVQNRGGSLKCIIRSATPWCRGILRHILWTTSIAEQIA